LTWCDHEPSLPSLSKIEPGIQSAEKNGKNKNNQAGNFDIDDLFHIMDDEGARISNKRGMFRSQPDLEMREGTVPVKYLDDEGKCKTREVEYLNPFILNSPKSAKEKEHNPEKMKKDNNVGKNLVKHSSV
jgi:hypothetical protein